MSHTNSTTNYSLPQFVTSDKPAWLTDVNNAYSVIDTGMHNAQTKANTADTNASQALLDAASAASAASAADAKGAGSVASLADTFQTTETYAVGDLVMYNNLLYKCTVAVDTPGAWTGSTNWTRATVEGVIGDLSASDISYGISSNVGTALDGKADKVGYGTYNFPGIWCPSFYAARTFFVPFPNADKYTVTLTRARYASDNTTMNDITATAEIATGGVTPVGVQVVTTSNCDLKYGDVQLTFAAL